MSEKLSERMNRDGGHSTVYVPEVAALEQQLAAKDAEIARLNVAGNNLAFVADKMAMSLKDAITLNPENFHVLGVEQLLTEWREANLAFRKLQYEKHAALAETPAAPIPVCEMCGWVKAECVCTTKRCPCGVLGCSGTHLRESSETPAAPTTLCGQAERDKRLIELTTDNSFIYYGPHPCSACGYTICKVANEQGGEAFDYPVGPIYPNTNWTIHNCQRSAFKGPHDSEGKCILCAHKAHLGKCRETECGCEIHELGGDSCGGCDPAAPEVK